MSGGLKNKLGAKEPKSNKFGVVFGHARITGQGASDPTLAGNEGIASFTRTAQGAYTVVFDHPYTSMIGMVANPIAAATDSWSWQIATNYVAATKTLLLEFVDEAGTAQDAIANDVHMFTFMMRTTTV